MRILLAVDESNHSSVAAHALEHFAPPKELIMLHVIDTPQFACPTTGPKIPQELATTLEQSMKGKGELLLERVISTLPSHTGPVTRKLESGSPTEVILATAERIKADLIVMGARGIGQIPDPALGSVSYRVMTHACCPTLVVKSSMNQLQHVLLPIENQQDADAVIAFFVKKPFRNSVKVTLLRVIPFSEPIWPVGAMVPESFREEVIAGAEKLTNDVALQLSALGHKAKIVTVMGAPSISILEETSAINPDLIVIGSQQRRGVSRFLLGSVCHRVAHQAPCSVLLLR
ncbi:MAG: hypothetical protein GKS05_09380 [Nitrospirales bacterium]|nr:hypothetical protein [Nitrospirales bacterium]